MIVIGIDCGSQNTRGVSLRDGVVVAKAKAFTEFDANLAAESVLFELIRDSGVKNASEVADVAVTGGGRGLVEFASKEISENNAAARGCHYYFPDVDTVIDMGAEGSRAVRINPDGSEYSHEKNDKCAAGAGVFIENMARALDVSPKEMGPLSLKHTKEEPMNVQCVVFAESEVISLVHANETSENIAYSIHAGVTNRIAGMVRRLGNAKKIAFIGGPSQNAGLVQCLEQSLGTKVLVDTEVSDYVSAVGAAIAATVKK